MSDFHLLAYCVAFTDAKNGISYDIDGTDHINLDW